MYSIILIFCLFGLIRLSVCDYFCESDSKGLNKCHDGGCNSLDTANEKCVCHFSENLMKGKYCGVYENKCLKNPCKNNGTCKSGIGHHICKCKEMFYGINCEKRIKKDEKFKHIRSPSIYYRIKSTIGEELYLLLVSESFGDKKYDVIIKGAVQHFHYPLDEFKQKHKKPDVIKLCSEKLNSKEFIVNKCIDPDNDNCQDMCNFIRNIYEHDKEVEFALIGPYFNTKTLRNKIDIFFDSNNTKKMGTKYILELQLYSTVEKKIDYKIDFIQFMAVIDDTSLCITNIDFDNNAISQTSKAIMTNEQIIKNIIPLKRKENWTLDIQVENDSPNLCNAQRSETAYWKIFNANKRILSYHNEEGLSYLDDSVMHGDADLVIDKYKLPMGIHIMYLNITTHNIKNGKKISNLYFRCIETLLDGLVAKITGPSPLYIGDTFLTLDASESYNPNEKNTKKDLLFTWECNIVEDEICKKTTKSTSKQTLGKKLEKSYEYNFTLTLSVSENYTQSIGKPTEGIAKISVYTASNIGKELIIECFENCVPLSNPSSIIHLEAKKNFISNESLNWYYQEINNTTETRSSTDTIALTDVPNRMLIVNKNMLRYGTKYRFFVECLKCGLKNEIYITTISKPKVDICTISPDSGLAGKTLFTISCMNFTNENNTENTFEYYQKNKYDETSLGVLLIRGNRTMTNLKLTSSKYLTVKVINKFGASTQVNLTVDVKKCNSHSMKNLFKELKTNSMNKDISRTVSIIAILSDLLRENHINKFNKLFNILAQIPIKNCIFCSVQFISILQKVMKDYNEVANGKMEINTISKMSKELLRVSDFLYVYIKTSNETDKIIEVDNVEQIKEGLKTNLAIFKSNQFNITKPNDPSERFFWSSMDNMNIITESTDNLLKMFGKSIILELAPYYERLIICVKEIKDVNACILSSEWLKNRTFHTKSNEFLYNTIDRELGNELVIQGKEWGIIMFNVENDLIQSFDIFEDSNINFQIVSFDVLRFNQNNPRELIEYHSFEKPIHLNFKMNKTNMRKPKEYTIWVPSKNCSNLEFDKTLLVYRIDMINIQHLFVTLSDSTHDLRFTWLYDKRPDIGIMNNETYTINIMAGEKYEFTLKTFSERQNNIHYIGISANMDQKNTTQIHMSNIHFSMDMFSPQCVYWNGKKWTTKKMFVGSKTTKDNIYCETNHVSLFGGLILTLPNITDPVEEVFHYESIANNMVCLILVAVVFIIYLILLVWCIHQDKKDVSRGEIIILHDNYPGEDEVYLITVYTGNSLEAGTTANVCIQLYGAKGTSRAHWLYNHDSDVLQRFNDDWFIIFAPKSLGELQYIRIWYDNYGSEPDWYCKYIEVTDVRGKRKWNFNVEQWFSLSPIINQIEQSISVGIPHDRKRQVTDDVELTLREDYQWASVFFR
ncbi:PKD/REJ-like domain,EGF-like, conserved site,EGF-like domain,PLAT/LH2 domain [Cinara cedri]|uniref:PKD/REJ-like domain,EGF-like, conserved site,EGF-like domain,PLAT/LH2 domain n=1 Tax=Cinara cedri TaxID=506608 RepID=A0A5E4NK63_9HEMI|nr:PKD/REJ-like domain,EGF-like, conserved site,EGF-like domain,PLAT/LH2 domain [Cinara cedri]